MKIVIKALISLTILCVRVFGQEPASETTDVRLIYQLIKWDWLSETPEKTKRLLSPQLSKIADFQAEAMAKYSFDWRAESGPGRVPAVVIRECRDWAARVLTEHFAPSLDSPYTVHYRDSRAHLWKSCDAIRIVYEKSGYRISVAQTKFTMLVQIHEHLPLASYHDLGSTVLASKALSQNGGVQKDKAGWYMLDVRTGLSSFSARAGRPSFDNNFGFHILYWLYDPRSEESLGCFGIKVSNENKPGIELASLEANKFWFEAPPTSNAVSNVQQPSTTNAPPKTRVPRTLDFLDPSSVSDYRPGGAK